MRMAGGMSVKRSTIYLRKPFAQRATEKLKKEEGLTAIDIQYRAAVIKSTTVPSSTVSLSIFFVDRVSLK